MSGSTSQTSIPVPWVTSSFLQVYKNVLELSLQKSKCVLNDGVLKWVSESTLAELRKLARENELNASDLDGASQVYNSWVQANKNQKFALTVSSHRGRYFGLKDSYFEVKVENEAEVDDQFLSGLRRSVADFGERGSFSQVVWGFHNGVAGLVNNVTAYVKVGRLISKGILGEPRYLTENGICSSVSSDTLLGEWSDLGNYVQVKAIKMQLFAHNPTSVVMEFASKWRTEEFKFSWKTSENGDVITGTFFSAKPEKMKVTFPAEIHCKISRYFSPREYFKWGTLGILGIHSQEKTHSWTTNQFQLTVVSGPEWYQHREKVRINISLDDMNAFQESHKKLIQLKLRLSKGAEIKQLTDEMKKQVEEIEEELQNEYSALAAAAAANQFAKVPPLPGYLGILEEAAQAALLDLIAKKPQILKDFSSFSQLKRDPTALNNLLGHLFEEMTAGRILAEAQKEGINLLRIAGDGRGVLPKGQPTPEYTDLVFLNTDTGKYQCYQFKLSDNPDYVETMVKDFFKTWGNKPEVSGIPKELKIENIEIVAPKGIGDKMNPVEVQLTDPATGRPVSKNVNVKTNIKVGDGDINVPSLNELKKLLETNYDMAREIREVGLVQSKNNLLKKITGVEKKIADQMKLIEQTNHPTALENLTKKMEELKNQLNEEKTSLEVMDEVLNDQTNRVVSTDSRNAVFKQQMKMVGIQCLIGAAVSGVTTLVISIDQEYAKYKRGEISGGEMVKRVTWETTKATIGGAVIAGLFAGGQIGLNYMANASNALVAGTGSVLGKSLGPTVLIGALAYQTYHIISNYMDGNITALERDKLLTRMLGSTGLSVGGAAGAAFILGTGPLGLTVGAGACIVVALGDYFLGDKLATFIFGDDTKFEHDKLEKDVLDKAYKLFNLEEHCSDEELKDAKRAALLKYHPDKCQGGEEEKEEYKMKTQAIIVAFAMIVEHRKK